MIDVSDLFKQYASQNNREFEIKAEIDSVTYDKTAVISFEIEDMVASTEDFTIGTVIPKKATISVNTLDSVQSNAKITPYVRMNGASGWTEWVPLWSFYVDSRNYQNGVWSFSCFDKLILTQQTFVSALTYPETMQNVFEEICQQLGLEIDSSVVIDPSYMIPYKDLDITYRQMLGYIAGAHGASIYLTTDEKIAFKTFDPKAVATTLTPSDYFKAVQTNPEKTFDQITLTYNTDGETLTAPARLFPTFANQDFLNDVFAPLNQVGAFNPFDMRLTGIQTKVDPNNTLEMYNPFMTIGMLNKVYEKLSMLSYTPFNMEWKGLPYLESGDFIQITLRDGTTITSLIMSQKLSFKGGLKATSSTTSSSKQKSETKYNGSVKQTVDQLSRNSLAADKDYFGVTIGRANGLKIVNSNGVTQTIINSDTWEISNNGDIIFGVDSVTKKLSIKAKVTMEEGSVIDWNVVTPPNASQVGAETPGGAQAKADVAIAAAAAAQSTANTAVTNAALANGLLADMSNDNKLTAQEKSLTKKEWDSIVSEVTLNDAQATAFSITTEKTAYDTTYNALNTYITPLLTNLGTTSDIVGTTFRSTFKVYYDARTNLLNAISAKAKSLADAAQTQANTATTNAANAQAAANAAQSGADTANGLLADIASDSKLTATEKIITKKEWDAIVSEVTLNDTQATTFGITTQKTTYDNAYLSLNTYITPLIASLTTTSTIVGTTFRSTFKTYYDARTDLLNAIAAKAKILADGAQGTANTAVTNAATAQSAADAAQASANSANNLLVDIADDNKLTPSEKQETKKEWNSIVSEVVLNDVQANTFSIVTEKATYDNAYSALSTYITPLLASLVTTSSIVGTTFRDTFKAYYDARTGLLNAIATKAKSLADAAQADADTAVANAAAAQTAANNAQTTANTAKAYTDNLASDSVITPDEKLGLKQNWDLIVLEGTATTGKIPAQAIAFGVSHTTFDTAYSALNTYLNTTTAVFASMTTATTGLVRATWDAKWKDYYNARTDLLNAIAAKAKAVADAAVTPASLTTTLGQDYIITGKITATQIYGGTMILGGSGNTNGVLSIKNASGVEVVKGDNTGLTVDGGAYYIKDKGGSLLTTVWSIPNMLYDPSFECLFIDDRNTADVAGMPPNASPYYDYYPNMGGNWYRWSTWTFNASGVETTQMHPYFASVKDAYLYNYASFGQTMICVNSTNYFSQGVDLIPGKTYFLSASHCRIIGAQVGNNTFRSTASSNLRLEVAWTNNMIETGTVVTNNYTSSTSWARDGFSFTVPASGVNGARIKLKSQDANWIYIDAVQLVQGSSAGKFDADDELWSHVNDIFAHKSVAGYPVRAVGVGGTWPYIPTVGADGVMEVGKYLDFHLSSNDGVDYNSRLTASGGNLYYSGGFYPSSSIYLVNGTSPGYAVRNINTSGAAPCIWGATVYCSGGNTVYVNFPAMAGAYYVVVSCNDSATPCRAWYTSNSQIACYTQGTVSGTIHVVVVGFV